MIAPDSIEKLNSITDITQVISNYIPIKRSGADYVALCPFHGEKTPSLHISKNKNLFHCFGCKMGGDSIKFVMEYEKLTYPEAVEKVASLMNYELSYIQNNKKFHKLDRSIIKELSNFYEFNLRNNKFAKEYLYKRGLNDDDINKFHIGFAPSSDKTLRFLQNENVNLNDALNLGLIKKSENNFYASFINRITFPIIMHSNYIGFGGRTIDNHPAKYVNSPQSSVFDKSRIFYGFDNAMSAKSKKLIILEGFLDCIFMQKFGFLNSVAVLGTALTKFHIPLIKDYEIILCFDGDSAGEMATIKSIKLLLANNIDCSVIRLPNGIDPAELLADNKIEVLNNLLSNQIEGGEFLLRHIANEFDLNRPIGIQNALSKMNEFLNTLDDNVKNFYKEKIKNILGKNIKFNDFATEIPKMQSSYIKRDLLELSILKTMMINKNMFLFFKKIADERIFRHHIDLIGEFLNNKDCKDQPKFREILMDSSIKELEFDDFHKGLINLKISYLSRLKDLINLSNDKDKLQKLIKIEKILINLRQKI